MHAFLKPVNISEDGSRESRQLPLLTLFILDLKYRDRIEEIYAASHVGGELAERLEFLTYLRASGMRTRGVL